MKIAALLFLIPFAAAECPNACSGHGECGQFDSCDCYTGFQGGDCSERVCAYNWAWVTTANGDLNFDGDRYDGTVYSTEVSISQTEETLLTQAAPGGAWETWPYYQTANEGHFYMECSNRGLCDRSTGECQCFDGFAGHACNRMACPEDCNGRGRCKSTKDLTTAYTQWDRDMARECVCDPGFTGPTCADRLCPYGNDVLTKTNEYFETQMVEIYTKCEGHDGSAAIACTGDLANAASGVQLGGTFTLTYTDHYGESYTTSAIALDDYDGSTQTVANAAKAALLALPNDVISDTIEVTASSCYTVDEIVRDLSTTYPLDISGTAPLLATYESYTAAGEEGIIFSADAGTFIVDTGTPANNGQTATATTPGNTLTATQTVFRYQYPICLRLKVDFKGMSGDLNDLSVDISGASYQGFTNDQYTISPTSGGNAGDAHMFASVTDTYMMTSGQSFVSYTSGVTITTASADASISGKDVTIVTESFTETADQITTFYPGAKVRIECMEVTDVYRNLGIYSIDTLAAKVLTTVETIVGNTCSATSKVRITQLSAVIALTGTTAGNSDLGASGFFGLGDASSDVVVGIDQSGVKTIFGVKVDSSLIRQQKIFAAGTGDVIAYIILDTHDGSFTLSSLTGAAGRLYIDGGGSMENNECGDRGLCDTETGECKCFAGYTGDACDIQKSISA